MIQTQTLAKEFAMSPRRLAFGLFWVCGLAVLQIWQVVANRDDWPLSAYPMYSGLQRNHVSKEELRAVSVDGEHSFTTEQLYPLSPRTVSLVLRHSDPKRAGDIRRAIFEQYYQRMVSGEHNGPLLSSLRLYQHNWPIRPDLSNRDKPKLTLLQTIPAFEPRLTDALEEQSRGKWPAPAPISAGAAALVLNLATATLGGGAERSVDPFAANGAAVLFAKDNQALTHAQATPSAYVDLMFRAPSGRYKLWLRGKGKQRAKRDSVWVQLDREVGTTETKYRDPLGKPETVTLTGDDPHVLRVSVREGPVVIDQVVLSQAWLENPGQMGPAL
jgi:hypothetical protein